MVPVRASRLESRYLEPGHSDWTNPGWPVLTSYRDRALDRVALPIGGIGTGTVSLGGRGDLRDWEIANRPAKGHNLQRTFFAVRGREANGSPFARCLEGPLIPPFEGAHGATATHAGLPRFESATFHAAYPLSQIVLTDGSLPVRARIEAFNPMVPPDADQSGIPVAVLRFAVENLGTTPIEISVAGTVQNFIGNDGTHKLASHNVNQRRTSDRVTGVLMSSDGLPKDAESWGTIALGAIREDGVEISTSRNWRHSSWSGGLLHYWDQLLADGRVVDEEPDVMSHDQLPNASVCARGTLGPGATRSFTFLIAWHFPNRMSWEHGIKPLMRVGNYYTTRYTDGWNVLDRTSHQLPALERDTVDFVSTFLASPLPAVVKEAALYNTSTLRTQTCFRTEDGAFFGWEGCNDGSGCCYGSCTHVWNYEQATPFLFGSLARSMRDVEFLHATTASGRMSFRSNLPLARAADYSVAAADGQMGCVMKLYREWRLCGDDGWLADLWPHARASLEFAWVPGGWDADQDGVMEGCQHNTMDCEYYGPNPQMGFWYLGALRAAEEMARHLGERDFADHCRRLFDSGSAWLDANVFNGEYYEHRIQPPGPDDIVADGLRLLGDADPPPRDPPLQLGAGCLVDQLVGQYMANVLGLGPLGDREHTRITLNTIKRYGFRSPMRDHFNHMRTYVLGDESAVLMCTYPRNNRPERPFPYFTEVMTGFEYTLAVHFLQEGMVQEGLEIIAAIRDRYDGERRSPFNEAECGHHYARAMASWAAVIAMSGFDYDARTGSMTFARLPTGEPMFWSNGSAWGTVRDNDSNRDQGGEMVEIVVHQGQLHLASIAINGKPDQKLSGSRTLVAGQAATF